MYANYQKAMEDMRSLQTAKANVIGFWEKLFLQKRRSRRKMGVDAHFSDLQNRVAAEIFQRFHDTD